MSTLLDEDLTRLLEQAAATFDVPDHAPVVEALQAQGRRTPLPQRRGARLLVAAAVLMGAVALGVTLDGRGAVPAQPVAGARALPVVTGPAEDQSEQLAPEDQGAETESGLLDATAAIPAPAMPAPAAPAPGAAPPVPVQAPVLDQGRVVKTGTMALTVDDGRITATLSEVQRAAVGQGGLVFGSSTQESGETPSGTVTVRVPVERFEATVLAVRGLDAEVRSAETTANEVTAQYADLDSQIRSQTASRERFLAILEDANDIGAVLAVQQRIDAATAAIDQLQGQLNVLAAQSEMSTLAVTVTEADDPVVDGGQSGLAQAWDDAVDGFTSGVEGLIRRSGRVLLAGLCLVAAFVVLRAGYRVARRRLV